MRACSGLVFVLLIGLAGVLPCTDAVARQWTCRNNDFEISCGEGRCAAQPSGGFTPLSVSLDADGGQMSVCAYSGCWEGRASIVRRGTFRIHTGLDLKWTGVTGAAADFAVVLDLADRVAVLKGAGFALPLTCE